MRVLLISQINSDKESKSTGTLIGFASDSRAEKDWAAFAAAAVAIAAAGWREEEGVKKVG